MDVKEQITTRAAVEGFSCCGFAKAEPLTHLKDFYTDFLQHGSQAYLGYLAQYAPQRLDPEKLMPGVRTIITLLFNYYPAETIPEADNFVIARYAYGKDRHILIPQRLKRILKFIRESFPGSIARSFYDSGPILEKVWAQRCGTGWQGKNTLLIHPEGGSFFNIGLILTNLEIEPDPPHTDHCGHCNRCRQACPTGALDVPYQLRIDRCIAYHTIENRGEFPEDLRGKFRNRIYGCEICQDVCPYNRKAVPTKEPECNPSAALLAMRRQDWLDLSEEQFHHLFRETPLARLGYARLRRNIQFNLQSDSPQR